MNVLRVAPYPLEVSFDVPSPSVEYTLKVIDSIDGTTESTTITSGVNSKLEYPIGMDRLRFDREFEVQVYEADDIVAEDHLSIVRPYVDPKALATGATDIVEYTKYEVIARAIIDGIIKHGFYNRKHILQGEGEGTDVFPLWGKTNKVIKVLENGTSIYDSAVVDNEQVFTLTDNMAGIQRFEADTYNRSQSSPVTLFSARGNLAYIGYRGTAFPQGYDFTFVLDVGYKSVPSDIILATTLLIDDLKCGRLDYYKRYVSEYDAIDFKMVFDKGSLVETGNNIVDKILKNYKNDILKPGIL